jgi:hypothetical protein
MGCLETRFLRLKSSTTLYAFAGGGVFSGLVLCTVLWVQYARLETLYGWSYYYNRGAVPAEGKRLRELLDYRRSSLFKAQAELLVSWNLPLNGIDLNDKLAMSERAMRYQPESNIVYRHVVLLGLSGQQEKALFYLLRLKNTYPDDFNDTHNALIRLAASQPDPFASLVAEASRRGLLQQD